MHLYFAGLARDCSNKIRGNIKAVLSLAHWLGDQVDLRLFIAENGSIDETRSVILEAASEDPRIVPVLLGDLDGLIPIREARIAFCRNRLLDEILKHTQDGLYVPIDLDSEIASSFQPEQFLAACKLVLSNRCTAIFPFSIPYYYDIHALRDKQWCSSSCWKQIHDARPMGELLRTLAFIRYISSRQISHVKLRTDDLIPVQSAFGGAGIYQLKEVLQSRATYWAPEIERDSSMLCEHVVFNSFLDNLFISPHWLVWAPTEHIAFRMLPGHRKAFKLARAALNDFLRLATYVGKVIAKIWAR